MSAFVTLQDLAKQVDPKGNLAKIAERMTLENEIIQDAHWEEANDISSHKYTFRTAVPKGSWRLFNQGVGTEAANTGQGVAFLGMHENRVKVDKRLCDLAPDPEKYYSNEVYAHSEGSVQFLAEKIFYGNHKTNAAAFSGLAPQLDSLALDSVFDAGGAAVDMVTSIYGVEWGPGKVYMVKPRGSKVPIEVGTKKEGVTTDENGNEYDVYRTVIIFNAALVVEDPRYVFRIANIDPTKKGTTDAGYMNEDLLIEALNSRKNKGKGIKLYTNQDVQTMVDIRAKDKASFFSVKDVFGEDITHFKNRPFRLCESILSTEEIVA